MKLFRKLIQMNDNVRFFSEKVTIAFITIHYLLFEIVTTFSQDYHSNQIFARLLILFVAAFAVGLYRWRWVIQHRSQLNFALNLVFCLYLSSEIYFHHNKEALLYVLWIFVVVTGSYSSISKKIILFLIAYLSSSFVLWIAPEAARITLWEYIIFVPQGMLVYFFIAYKIEFHKQQLTESNKMFRLLFKHSPVGMLMLYRLNEPLRKINSKLAEILGYSKQELSKMTMRELSHPEDAALFPTLIEQALSSGNEYVSMQKRMIHKTGRVINVLGSIHIFQKKEKPTLIIGIIQDISEIKRAENKLKTSNRMLKESNADYQEFAYSVSHDLKEPVRNINSFCQLLPKYLPAKGIQPEVTEFLNFITGSAQHMSKQIDDLLNYSRIGQDKLMLSTVHTENTMAVVQQSLKMLIEENNARIETKNLPVVTAETFQLQSLFQNLISNAIKYRKPELAPRIRITAKKQSDHWQFSVADNGTGIKPEFRTRIFTVFYRLHSREEIPGTGIGLAICRRIVQRHGGEIWVESEYGEGSTFYFTIPMRKINHNGAARHNGQLTIEKKSTSVEALRAAVR